MDDPYNYDLEAAGLREGDIVTLNNCPTPRHRVIRHPETGDLCLQNPGEDGQFLDLTLEEGVRFQ